MPPSATYILSNAAWAAKTGAVIADLGFPEPAATQATFTAAPGDSALLRAAPNGEIALALTGAATAAGTGLAIRPFSDAEVDSWVNASGKCARIRQRVIFEKGTADGTSSFTARIVFGTTAGTRFTHTYGAVATNNDGVHLHLTAVSATNNFAPRRLKWGVVHLIDTWIENLDGTNYRIVTFIDGQFYSYYTTTTASQVRGHIRCVWDGGLGSGGTPTHWINWLGMRVDLYASGGIDGNWEGLDEADDGGRYDLPAYADDSVVTMHGCRLANGSAQDLSSSPGLFALDAAWYWPGGSGLSGTLSAVTDADFDASLAGSPRYSWANPVGTVLSRMHRRPREGGAACVRIPIKQFGDSRVEWMLHAADGTPEVGIRVPEGATDTTLRLLYYDGFSYQTVNTGIPIVRSRGYIVQLSFVQGRGVGVTVNDLTVEGSTAAHLKPYTDDGTAFVGLPAEIGYTRMTAVLNVESASPVSWWGPQFGARLAMLAESSYSNTTAGSGGLVRPVSSTPGYWARRGYDAELGRGAPSSGFTRRSLPSGPFCCFGRSGMQLSAFITNSLGGDIAAWVAASAAFPLHIIDGKINGTVNTPGDISGVQDATQALINAYRADPRAVMLVGSTPAPSAFASYVAGRVDNHLAINQWLRDLNTEGGLAGLDTFDMAAHFGGESEATAAVRLNESNIHPQGNDGSRAYLYGLYASAGAAFAPAIGAGGRSWPRRGLTAL